MPAARPHAPEDARAAKAGIGLVGAHGIPVRDELRLVLGPPAQQPIRDAWQVGRAVTSPHRVRGQPAALFSGGIMRGRRAIG